MLTLKKKELKELVTSGKAKELTREVAQNLMENHSIEKIGVSIGTYGISGGLLQDTRNDQLYVISSRSSLLLMIF